MEIFHINQATFPPSRSTQIITEKKETFHFLYADAKTQEKMKCEKLLSLINRVFYCENNELENFSADEIEKNR
jgi:hypothetical protein